MAPSPAADRLAPRPEPVPGAPARPAWEPWFAGSALALLVALRVVYALHRPFNSDEPQHLHVVWAWTRGLLPYRDVHDNHAPLFHILMAPILAVVGERAEALVAMRFAVFPLFAVVLLATRWLGRSLFSPRVGMWAVALAAAWPQHFLTSMEFRADDLWAALWLLSLGLLLAAPAGRARSFAAGVLAGAAAATSLKTSLLVLALGAAQALSAAMDHAGAFRGADAVRVPPGWTGGAAAPRRTHPLVHVALWIAGLAIVPAAVAGTFAAQGAFAAMVHATVLGNALEGLWTGSRLRPLLFPLALPVALGIARLIAGTGPRAPRRATFFLSGALYYAALVSFWPLLTPQDDLPVEPMAAVAIAALLLGGEARSDRGRRALAVAALVLLGIGVLVLGRPPWQDRTGRETRFVRDVLALTGRDEYVMDLKGENVFRRRPVGWVLESVTQERFRRGLMRDDISAELAATRTAVAVPDHYKLPPRIRAFLDANYVGVGAVRVLGRRLAAPPTSAGSGGSAPISFAIVIPERYVILAGGHAASGRLDGTATAGPRWLDAGPHQYLPTAGERDLLALWARAAEKGYAPPPPPQTSPESR